MRLVTTDFGLVGVRNFTITFTIVIFVLTVLNFKPFLVKFWIRINNWLFSNHVSMHLITERSSLETIILDTMLCAMHSIHYTFSSCVWLYCAPSHLPLWCPLANLVYVLLGRTTFWSMTESKAKLALSRAHRVHVTVYSIECYLEGRIFSLCFSNFNKKVLHCLVRIWELSESFKS